MQELKRNWYAIYTRPRWEKKTDRLLHERGVISYCPLQKFRRQWSDRVKAVELPIFTSYVFVYVTDAEMNVVRTVPGVLNFVYWNGKPAIVKDQEIRAVQRFLGAYDEVEVLRTDIKPGDEVSVAAGLLMDCKGKVESVSNRTVRLRIDSLRYELVAYVDKMKVQRSLTNS